MNLKNVVRIAACAAATGVLAVALAGCGSSSSQHQIAVPSDATNEARALLLLQDEGLLTLNDGAGLTATTNDIKENPYNIQFVETEAASVPRTLSDVDAAVINGNYALGAGLDPSTAFAAEGADSQAAQEYGNVVAVRSGDEKSAKTEALLAALQSQRVSDFITSTYSGTVVPVFTVVDDIPQATGDDTTIKVGASPTPHAEILNAAKDLLAAKGWTLEVVEFTDYVQPNVALSDGSLDANYFQHQPYLDNYNEENGTDLVGVAKIHFEAMALYGGKAASLDDLKKEPPAVHSVARKPLFGAACFAFGVRKVPSFDSVEGAFAGAFIYSDSARTRPSLQAKGLPTREPLFVLLLVLLFVVEEVLVLHDCQICNRFVA